MTLSERWPNPSNLSAMPHGRSIADNGIWPEGKFCGISGTPVDEAQRPHPQH
jgi:hypothetical protein